MSVISSLIAVTHRRRTTGVDGPAWLDSHPITTLAPDGAAIICDSAQPDGVGASTLKRTSPLGGSRQIALPQVAAPQDAIDYLDLELDGGVNGRAGNLRVECRTTDASTSITPKLRNVTDGTDAGVGVACSATTYAGTNGIQIVAVVLAAGVKKYRLQGTPGDVNHPTFAIGYLETWN
jgi:hypothetical protein